MSYICENSSYIKIDNNEEIRSNLYLPNESTKHTAYGIALSFLIKKRFALDEINIKDIDDDTKDANDDN